ncbi:MAG: hypothetical protein IJC50_05735 [Clostridia bacterium]|nr:hypothetical protein [Clostridia bacterium]
MKNNKKSQLPSVEIGGELTVDRPKAEPNEYYIDLSRHIKITKMLLILFLVVFLLGMITIFRHDITLENYQYMIRIFTSSGNSDYAGDYQPIYFDANGTTRLGIFNGDLAVVKRDGVNFYGMSGSNTMNQKVSYSNPALITNGKYMLTYDIGGYSFDLFNNFSRLAGETFDYPISTAAVSREGMYAVVTKSLEYQSQVNLYDHNFTLLTRILKDKYVMAVGISDDASEILVMSVYSENGKYSTEIMTLEPYSNTAKSTYNRVNSMAILGGYHTDGSYSVLCSDALLFFDKDGNLTSEYPINAITPTKCIVADDCTILAYNENIVGSTTDIIVFSNEGEQITTLKLDDKLIDVDCSENTVYMLCNNDLIRLDLNDPEPQKCRMEGGGSAVFIADAETVIISYSNKVQPYSVQVLFGNEDKVADDTE